MRYIPYIQSCTDRKWICHVAEPADFEEYEREWQATNAVLAESRSDLDAFLDFDVGGSVSASNIGDRD